MNESFNKRFYIISCLFCLILLLAGCTAIEHTNNIQIEKNFPGLTERNIEWIKAVNNKDSLNNFYYPSSVLLFENDWYLTQEEIQKKLHDFDIRERVVHNVYKHSSNDIRCMSIESQRASPCRAYQIFSCIDFKKG